MKTDIQNLIEQLEESSITCCSCTCIKCEKCKKAMHAFPILIGDVLDKLPEELWVSGNHYVGDGVGEFIHLWRQCGLTKSLQEIYEEAEWETKAFKDSTSGNTNCIDLEVPEQKPHRKLFTFLLSLNL